MDTMNCQWIQRRINLRGCKLGITLILLEQELSGVKGCCYRSYKTDATASDPAVHVSILCVRIGIEQVDVYLDTFGRGDILSV